MDEYIKREDVLKAIEALPNVCGCSAIDRTDAEVVIMDCPTADVAPKSEIHDDHHKQVACYSLGCQEGDKIKQEVAREIFEEIEQHIEDVGFSSFQERFEFADFIAELKKKYMEEKK